MEHRIRKVACNSVEIATKCAFMEAAAAFNASQIVQTAVSALSKAECMH